MKESKINDAVSSRESSDEFLTRVEDRIRRWIAREWDECQRIGRQATAENWSEALKAVHIRSVVLTVETLAPSLGGLSEPTLRRRFQQAGSGESPGDMIHRLRMEHAAKLLSEGRYTIAAVAHMCGFRDQRHFSSRFRDRFGMTPREYRQKYGET